jgi:hypothetical protein
MNLQKGSINILLIISIVLFLITLVYSQFAPDYLVSRSLLYLVPFFLVISLISRLLLLKVASKQKNKLTHYFFSISAGKFMLYLAVMITYGFFCRDDAVAFIISFFIFYIIYTYVDMKAFMKITSK